MQRLLDDLRYAARQLRKSPSFTLLVILTIALGIGANTAIFSLINGYLRPLPVADADQIVVLAAQTPGDQTGFGYRFSIQALREYRQQTDRFTALFGFQVSLGGLNAGGKTAQFVFSAVTGDFFTGLGLKPAAGRLLVPGEGEQPGSELLCVLSYTYWQKRFGGDPSIVGRQVRLDGKGARVIGIAPRGFHGAYAGADMDGYFSFNILDSPEFPKQVFTDRSWRALTVLGRLKPGVSAGQAQSSIDAVARHLEEQHPESEKGITVRVMRETVARPIPLRFLADATPVIRGFVLTLGALVLLLACMNVANLLMVRATIREREMAIRAALGSGRTRLIRQMLTESLMLALAGGVAGLAFGKWGSDALAGSLDLATDFPILLDFSFDWRVFVYAFGAALLTGILIGLWPAFRASRVSPSAVLRDGGHGGSGGPARQRLRGMLVVGQVAGSLVLLIVAGLMVRNLRNAQHLDLGFKSSHVLNARFAPQWAGYDKRRTEDFYRELMRRVKTIPGVESASLAFSVPMGFYFDGSRVFAEDRAAQSAEQPPTIFHNRVSPRYFDTIGIPIVRGRAFGDTDDASAPLVAIVNQTMAARLWPNQNPIGKRIRLYSRGEPLIEIVGVARDSKYLAVFENSLPYLYLPLDQDLSYMRVLQLRTSGPPEYLASRLRAEIQALDPEVPVADLQTMDRAMSGGVGVLIFRVGAIQAAAMGILGMALAIIGVYGVVSYGAAQRTREIGIRMALGALPADILSMILRQGVYLVIGGVVVGLGGAAAIHRVIGRYLMLGGTDPTTFVAVTFALGAIALAACCIPARRAMRVDPMVALRHD